MEPNKNNNLNGISFFIIVFQLVAWVVAISPFFSDFTGSDPAGNGMEKGLTFLFFTVPGMFFIFISNFYLAFKKSLGKWCRYFSVINIIGLLILFGMVDW
ncbi:MAG: hypothetical protein GY694_03820 [Gammaproteobacteria bacterium]|nr:hypothetical protein [Gammaproteobacteria bacterium]